MAKPTKILLIDDDEFVLGMFEIFLQQQFSCPIDTAAREEQVQQLIEKYHYDLILSDVNVADQSGFDIINACYSAGKINSSQVIFISGDDPDELQAKNTVANSLGILQKTADLPALCAAIQQLIEG